MTLINHTHKFIFIHAPKNAGTTLTELLTQFTLWNDIELGGTVYGEAIGVPYASRFGIGKHARAINVRNLVGNAYWDSYFTFAFARNPFSRAYSIFRFLKKWNAWDGSEVMDQFATFSDFVESRYFQDDPGPDYLFKPQHFWIADEDGLPIVDYSGRVETFADSIAHIQGKLSIEFDSEKISVTNESGPPEEYSSKYSPTAQRIVADIYRHDFEIFGYDPILG